MNYSTFFGIITFGPGKGVQRMAKTEPGNSPALRVKKGESGYPRAYIFIAVMELRTFITTEPAILVIINYVHFTTIRRIIIAVSIPEIARIDIALPGVA